MLSKILPKNEHVVDRAVRVVLGLGLLSAAVAGPHAWWGWLGVVPLLTGAMGSCPAYTLLGVSTRKSEPRLAT